MRGSGSGRPQGRVRRSPAGVSPSAMPSISAAEIGRRRKPELPPKAPREIALEDLEHIRNEIERINPYQFSIRVSDILRRYVSHQYGVPATRQTSIEFLTAAAKAPSFSADDKSLLEDFLNRCDLIKFAKYEATTSDSELLLEEAIRFVKGGQLAAV